VTPGPAAANRLTDVKWCSSPKHEGANPLPLSEFHKRSARPCGYAAECRACKKARKAAYRAANLKKVRAQDRGWRAGYRSRNPEQARASVRAWAAANPEKIKANNAAWKAANPERVKELTAACKARTAAKVFGHYGTVCACCGTTENLCIDHIAGDGREHRLELYGRDDAAGFVFWAWLVRNGFPPGYQTLCMPCNTSKGRGERCKLAHSQREVEAA
jgi:hypothetical protein